MPKIHSNTFATSGDERTNSARAQLKTDVNSGRPLVTLSKGYTIHLGDHQFVKIQAEASCFTNPTEQELADIAVTFEKLSQVIDAELEFQTKEAMATQ